MFRASTVFILVLSAVSLAQGVPPSSVPASRLAHIRHGINLSEWFAQVYDPKDTPKNTSRPGLPQQTSR